jgi:hypothetical protein
MRTFVSALLLSTALAQNTTAAVTAVQDSWSSVKNWFAETTVTYLQDEQLKQPFGNYTSAANHNLTSTISLDTTLIGANFVTVAMDLSSSNSAHWVNGTYSLLYFQIEEPVPAETTEGARLLQTNATATEAAPVTGTGNFEGWLGLLAGPNTVSGPVKLAANKQLWGTTNMNTVNDWFTTFGNTKGATATVDADPWQPADAKLQTFTAANATHPGVWHA